MPFPFQIFQTPEFVAITYEYVHASRTVHMTNPKHLDDISFWMGDSRGHWEGDTLVVDVADNEPTTGWTLQATSTAMRFTWSSATRARRPTRCFTKRPSRTRRFIRGRGKSAFRFIATRRRTRSFTNTSATCTRKAARDFRRTRNDQCTRSPVLALASCLALVPAATVFAQGQGRGPGRAQAPAKPFTRLADGKPDMQGYWQTAVFFSAFDLETHDKAEFEIPAGKGVVVDPPDGKIPYQPWALEKKKDLMRAPSV